MGRLADEMSAIFLTSKMSASFFFDVKNVSEFFFDASDFINLRFRVRKAPERRRPEAVAPPVRSKQVIRMSGGSVGGRKIGLMLKVLEQTCVTCEITAISEIWFLRYRRKKFWAIFDPIPP